MIASNAAFALLFSFSSTAIRTVSNGPSVRGQRGKEIKARPRSDLSCLQSRRQIAGAGLSSIPQRNQKDNDNHSHQRPCIALPNGATMGFHYLQPSRVDSSVDPAEPELLLYLPN